MKAFIFDKYGYYIDKDNTDEFDFEGWHFKLEKTEKTEDELKELNEYLKRFSLLYYEACCTFVLNRDNHFISKTSFGNCVLVSVKNYIVNINDLFKMHTYFKKDYQNVKYTIFEMQKLWEDKVDLVEEKILPSFKIDDYTYENIMTTLIYVMGLCENALQYLAEIRLDYGDNIENLSLTHKRFYKFDSYEFFSPFNLIVDSPMRDLAELYKSEFIDNNTLINILEYYHPSKKEVSILLARILFPTQIFDLLDDYYILKQDVRNKILEYKEKFPKYMENVKMLERKLVKKYAIRPISWLE